MNFWWVCRIVCSLRLGASANHTISRGCKASEGITTSGMRLTPLAIDEADNAGNSPVREKLGAKDVETVDETRHDNVFAAKGFFVCDVCGGLRRHARGLALLSDAGAGAEFGLSDALTK